MIADDCSLKAPEIDAWLDCGKPETILQTNAHLLKGRHHIHGEACNCVFIEPVYIERGVIVRNSILGPNISIVAGSVIKQSIIRDSIVNGNSSVQNMILADTIFGDAVQLIGSPRKMNVGDHPLIEMQG